jgi:hypothetical protein
VDIAVQVGYVSDLQHMGVALASGPGLTLNVNVNTDLEEHGHLTDHLPIFGLILVFYFEKV